ncbi:MAG: CinA family protein, partial [Chloroflexota bacterium]
IIAYANSAKEHLLGVDRAILESHGAVSEECAIAMAVGAQRAFDAKWAVSTTGIAGPTGATPSKPVGLVYVAVAGPSGSHSVRHLFTGDRADITATSTKAALQQLLEAITGN